MLKGSGMGFVAIAVRKFVRTTRAAFLVNSLNTRLCHNQPLQDMQYEKGVDLVLYPAGYHGDTIALQHPT